MTSRSSPLSEPQVYSSVKWDHNPHGSWQRRWNELGKYTTPRVLGSAWEALKQWCHYCFKYRIAIKHLPNETTATLSGKKCNLYRISKCTNMMQIAVGKIKTLLKQPNFEWKHQAKGSSYFWEAARGMDNWQWHRKLQLYFQFLISESGGSLLHFTHFFACLN